MKNISESAWIFAVLVLFLMFLTPCGLNARCRKSSAMYLKVMNGC